MRTSSLAKGAPGGGSMPAPAPSGGTQIPPSPRVDGPAWFFAALGGTAGPVTANIDFDAQQNLSPGGIPVGTSRSATELVFNASRKTALVITGVSFVGANPADFSVPAADLAAAGATVLPANKGAAEALHVVFAPTGAGPRSATLQVTSAAGIAQIFLTGSGLPQRPVIAPIAPLSFLPASAPVNLTIQNTGGQTLSLTALEIGGTNPTAFAFFSANHGLGNCFAGMLLAWDLALDPAMSRVTQYWVWASDGPYYGMPLLNLFGWYVTGVVLMTALSLCGADAWGARLPTRWLLGFYVVNLGLSLGMIAAPGLWGALLVSLAGVAVSLATPGLVARLAARTRRHEAPAPASAGPA